MSAACVSQRGEAFVAVLLCSLFWKSVRLSEPRHNHLEVAARPLLSRHSLECLANFLPNQNNVCLVETLAESLDLAKTFGGRCGIPIGPCLLTGFFRALAQFFDSLELSHHW